MNNFITFERTQISKDGDVEKLGKVSLNPNDIMMISDVWDIHEVILNNTCAIIFKNNQSLTVAGNRESVLTMIAEFFV